MSYKVARASEYLVITGARIPDVKLVKKAWVWPGQHCSRINVAPINYPIEVQAMSTEKLPFALPAVFTIGPRTDDMEALTKFVKLMPPYGRSFQTHVAELINGIIQGETRVVAASMTIEEIFKGTKEFKQEVFEKVQSELNHLGLFIYNANVKQLTDVNGSDYFYHLGQKIQMEAAYNAKLDAAEADMKGKMGTKIREAKAAQNAAKFDTETRIFATQRNAEGKKEEIKSRTGLKICENEHEAELSESNSELDSRRAVFAGRVEKAKLETTKENAIREAELQLELEKKASLVGAERLRAELLNKATVESEAKVQETNSKYLQQLKYADALFYAEQKDAEVKKMIADVESHAKHCNADAELYAKKREAEVLIAMSDAHAYHVRSMLQALGGNYNAFRDYMMINNGMYKEIAKIGAESVKGLKPKVCVLANGGSEISGGGSGIDDVASALHKMSGIYKMLPPLPERVHEQAELVQPTCAAAAAGQSDGESDINAPVAV